MSLKECNVIFDNRPNGIFYSGETVSGRINLTLNKDKSCEGLLLKILGKGKCRWKTDWDSNYHDGKEIYIENEQYLKNGRSELARGSHSFNFLFTLPKGVPSSLDEHYGSIRYTLTITMKRSVKIDLSHTMEFMVISHIDLNQLPSLKSPVLFNMRGTYGSLFSRSGLLNITVQIPFSGYVPGQEIKINCLMKNESSVKVKSIKITFKKAILYVAKGMVGKFRKRETLTMASQEARGVEPKSENSIETLILIPSTSPSTLESSTIIIVHYYLEIIASMSGMRENLWTKIPITIGTRPISPENATFSDEFRSESPPPSYNDVMKNMKMKNEEEPEMTDEK